VSRDLGSQRETVFVKVPNLPMTDYEGFRRSHMEWKRKMNWLMDEEADASLKEILEIEEDDEPGPGQPLDTDSVFWKTYTTLGTSSPVE
jgi:hypothetical protein